MPKFKLKKEHAIIIAGVIIVGGALLIFGIPHILKIFGSGGSAHNVEVWKWVDYKGTAREITVHREVHR